MTGHASMDQILANLADAVPDTFTDVSGEEAELPGEINDVMQVSYLLLCEEEMCVGSLKKINIYSKKTRFENVFPVAVKMITFQMN